MFDKDDPTAVSIDLNDPATNTVKVGESYLVLPVSGGTALPAQAPVKAPPKKPAGGSLAATGPGSLPAVAALLLTVLLVRRRQSTRAL